MKVFLSYATEDRHRAEQIQLREHRRNRNFERSRDRPAGRGAASRLAGTARDFAEVVSSFLNSLLRENRPSVTQDDSRSKSQPTPEPSDNRGPDR